MTGKILVTIALVTFATVGCTIKPPEVVITSEKTALEKQLLGSTEKVTGDPASMVAVWAALAAPDFGIVVGPEDTLGIGDLERNRVLLAQIRRQTLQNDINQLKKDGYLGESRTGFLEIRSDSARTSDALERLVEAENQDRSTIIRFYAASAGKHSDEEIKEAAANFASIMVRLSPNGTWVEDELGNWNKK